MKTEEQIKKEIVVIKKLISHVESQEMVKSYETAYKTLEWVLELKGTE